MGQIQYFWHHPLALQVREEGREEVREACRRMLLRFLEWSRGPLPDTARARIQACTDLDQAGGVGRRAHAPSCAAAWVRRDSKPSRTWRTSACSVGERLARVASSSWRHRDSTCSRSAWLAVVASIR